MDGNAYECRLASLMPCPFQPEPQAISTVFSWLAIGIAPAIVPLVSGPKMKVAWSCCTHLRAAAAAVAGFEASFSTTVWIWWPSRPPALLTMVAHAFTPSPAFVPSEAKGPDVAASSQMMIGELADPPPPPPELHAAAAPTTRSAPAAARPRARSRRARDGTTAGAALGFLAPGFPEKRRGVENSGSSIKAPLASVRTAGHIIREMIGTIEDVYRKLNNASTVKPFVLPLKLRRILTSGKGGKGGKAAA